jgi:signal transduction histidine kinase
MAAVLAHEVGNPLNAMYMNVQLLEQRFSMLGKKVDKSIESIVQRLKKEITRLSGLVEDFCSLARREKYDFQPVSLSGLVAEVLKPENPSPERSNPSISLASCLGYSLTISTINLASECYLSQLKT